MKCHIPLLLVALLLSAAPTARADFNADVEQAEEKLEPALLQAQGLLLEGRLEDASAKILSTFPEATRTAAEAFLVGNVLFRQDPKTSYAMHKRALAGLPDEPQVQLEWALELHRAKDYPAAAEAYAKIIDKPDMIATSGMLAECLLRTGKTAEAVAAFQRLHDATTDEMEQFEAWVCDVNGNSFPDRDRAAYLAKVRAGDLGAAAQLIALDGNFPSDWWNVDPREDYLVYDLRVLRDVKFDNESRRREIVCLGDCILASDADVPAVLRKAGLLLDDDRTLPRDGIVVSNLLQRAVTAEAISNQEARSTWGEAIRERAVAENDRELFSIARYLYLDDPTAWPEIERAAWEGTGRPEFGASFLYTAELAGALTLDDPLLIKLSNEHPTQGVLATLVLRLSKAADLPLKEPLIHAIEAQYDHFSLQDLGQDQVVPGADTLSELFDALQQEQGAP